MTKKYIKGLPSSLFDNLVVKKLKTYTLHPNFQNEGTKEYKIIK
jgi:hypothetical protein